MSFSARCLACGQEFTAASSYMAQMMVHGHVGGSRKCQMARQVERERKLLAARSEVSLEPSRPA